MKCVVKYAEGGRNILGYNRRVIVHLCSKGLSQGLKLPVHLIETAGPKLYLETKINPLAPIKGSHGTFTASILWNITSVKFPKSVLSFNTFSNIASPAI